MQRISIESARRIAIAAQGFADASPKGRVDVRHFRRIFDRIGLLQLDSVNVVVRSHYLPVLARLGPYSRDALDAYTSRSGEVFEYWGHEASLLPVARFATMHHRMQLQPTWRRIKELLAEDPGYVEMVYDEIASRGPLTVSDLSDPGERTGPWWGYGKGKIAVEWLFVCGRITAYRDGNFARLYDVPEKVIPEAHLTADPHSKESAYRELLMLGAQHHGIGTADDIIDYYRLRAPVARPILAALVEEGRLEECRVSGWERPAFLHPEAVRPRVDRGTALLSPFDPVVWYRPRAERLFDFHYRIEIYVPEPKRVYGYYVLPFLHEGRLVGRVDLKAERKLGRLLVKGAYAEEGSDRVGVGRALAPELERMAAWLGLDEVSVARRGDLAGELRRAL